MGLDNGEDRKILVGEGTSMFEVRSKEASTEIKRTPACLAKLDRMNKTLAHEEADRIPVGDFFWGQFLDRWKKELNLPADTDIYSYYDLDWITTVPNMDPHIKNFEFIKNTPEEVIVRTGFEAEVKKNMSITMPALRNFIQILLKKWKPSNLMIPGMTEDISVQEIISLQA